LNRLLASNSWAAWLRRTICSGVSPVGGDFGSDSSGCKVNTRGDLEFSDLEIAFLSAVQSLVPCIDIRLLYVRLCLDLRALHVGVRRRRCWDMNCWYSLLDGSVTNGSFSKPSSV
jgi:hypothetical protein